MYDIKTGISDFERGLDKFQKATDKALADALTWTAFDAKKGLQDEMESVFDTPTRWTLNSIFVKGAKPSNHLAKVGIKDKPTSASVAPVKYLHWEIKGGNRAPTRFERSLQASNILPRNFHAVIAREARRNKFGNLPVQRMRRILNDLKAGTAGISSGSNGYFVMKGDKSQRHRPLGIWQRDNRNNIHSVFTFTPRKVRYESQFDFYGVIKRVRDKQFGDKLRRALKKRLK